MLDGLPPRERQIVDLLYQQGPKTVLEICDALPDRLTSSAVRAMLARLETKGAVRRTQGERGFVYAPTLAEEKASHTALGHIVRTFFNGSAASAASALLGMGGRLKHSELDELEALIAEARTKEQR